MGEEVFIVAIVFGSILTIVFLGIVGSIINNWIKRGSKSEDITKNEEFLQALREFKEKTDRRLSNLEEIVTDEERDRKKNRMKVEEKQQSDSIEIEFNDEKEESGTSNSGNLRNMLNQ